MEFARKENLMSYETRFTIEWGDCDEAGIVFYPNYFYWLDCTFQRWLRSVGLSQRELRRRYGSTTPIIDVGASFDVRRATMTNYVFGQQ